MKTMVGKRQSPDGTVAERLYCRAGVRTTTFFYKHPDNRNEILATAPTARADLVALAKAQALTAWADMRGTPEASPSAANTLANLFRRYFEWQDGLPANSTWKKAASTLEGNRREAAVFLAVFGHMAPDTVTTIDLYRYVDARAAQGAPKVAVKEVALASAVYTWAIRVGRAKSNPCRGMKHEKAMPSTKTVPWAHIEHVTAVGRAAGGTAHIVALALRAAWLAFKRPTEVLTVRTSAITDAGLEFTVAKRRKTQAPRVVTISWTPTLRATVDEAMALKRWAKFGGDRLLFGNLDGHAYTRSGWGTELRKLMQKAVDAAREKELEFTPFNLRDCRPSGITEKKRNAEQDVYDGTGHADHRMVDAIYDRRADVTAKAAK